MEYCPESLSLRNFSIIYLSLLSLCLPLDFRLIPHFGNELSRFLEPVLQHMGETLEFSAGPYGYSVYSDSLGMYMLFVLAIPCAFLIQVTLSWASSPIRVFLYEALKILLMGFLALQLAQYGLQKLFMRQFFPLDGKLLFTPLGELEKDLLFWTTMGTSRLFNVITGVIELVIAVLVLLPRLRPFGGLLSLLVLAHILVLNLSFNIDVKLLVGLLLGISLLLSTSMLKALYSSLKTGMIIVPTDHLHARSKWAYVLMAMAIACELGLGVHAAMRTPDLALESSLLNRSFSLLNAPAHAPTRLHFHGSGYLIEEFEGSIFDPLPMTEDRSVQLILLTEHDGSLHYSEHGDTLLLSGTLAGTEVAWKLLELDLELLPLKQDTFRWVAP